MTQSQTDDSTDLTAYTRDPVVLGGEAEDDADLDRWQNYGHDRLYFNAATSGIGPIPGASKSQYLDLKTGEAVMQISDVYGEKDSHELTAEVVEEGVIRVENGRGTHVLTIDLFGERPETGEES
jgi:hypothetical protein